MTNIRTIQSVTALNNAFAGALAATAVKTSAYTSAVGDLVPVDATSGGVTVTLPTAPADKARVAVKKIDSSTNIVTVQRGGSSDVFNKAGGSTSLTLSLQNQAVGLQYQASTGIWFVVADDLPLSQTDARYAGKGQPARSPSMRRPLPAASTVIDTFQAGHGWTASADFFSAKNFNDTADYFLGTQSLSVSTTTTGGNGSVDSPTYGTAIDLTGKQIRALVKVDNLADLTNLRLFAGDAALANYKNYNINFKESRLSASYAKDGEWVWISFNDRLGTTTGTGSTAVKKWRLTVAGTSGSTTTVHLGAIEVRPTPTTFPNGVLAVCFDDGRWTPWINAKPKLDSLGFRPSLFPIIDRVAAGGGGNYMSWTEIKKWYDAGAEVGVHSQTGTDHDAGFDTLTPAQIEANILADRQAIYDNGCGKGEGFAWPLGAFTKAGADAAAKLCAYGRMNSTWASWEPWPPENMMRIRSYLNTINANVAAIEQLMNLAKADKSLLSLTFHEITATGTEQLAISQANFNTLMDYAASIGIEVMPLIEAVSKEAGTDLSVVPAAGDLSGFLSAPTVAAINGVAVTNHPTTSGQVPVSTGTTSAVWAPSPGDPNGYYLANRITSGESTISRTDIANTAASLGSSGQMLLTYFTAQIAETINTLTVYTGSTAAGATPTLVRAGIYSIDGNNDATLVASIANDTSIFSTIGGSGSSGAYTRNLDVAFNKVAGQRYAVGILVVTSAAMPNVTGTSHVGAAVFNNSPRLTGILASQTDLPASFANSSLAGTSKSRAYAELRR